LQIVKQQPSIHSVIAGHSRPKDGVASARLCPAIHLLRKMILRRLMDARIKSGHDERVLSPTPLSQDAESLETVIASGAKPL
jgi:hypothetical protein